MTKPLNEYTVDELSAKIEAIKAERERTANALKRYEKELERKRQEVPLGIPLEDKMLAPHFGVYEFGFASEKSFHVFNDRLKLYVETIQKLAKGEPIDIRVLALLLRKGWVAMYESGVWCWFAEKPKVKHGLWDVESVSQWKHLNNYFNIKSADNWETSLMECGI